MGRLRSWPGKVLDVVSFWVGRCVVEQAGGCILGQTFAGDRRRQQDAAGER